MYRPHPLDRRLAAVVPPGRLYAVGGRVRDEVRAALGQCAPPGEREPFDLDYLVTGLSAADLRERLERIGKVDLVGASFAIFKVLVDGTIADVALPRRERSTGPGHRDFEVHGGPEVSLEEDLARRDFRMNMLARALPGGELVDPYGGVADIEQRRIDILAERAFEEDPLRMLRAAQFVARFEYTPSERTIAAMRAAAPLVRTVAPERIRDELLKLLGKANKPSLGIELLRETGILEVFWAELLEGVGVEQNAWHAYDVYRHALATLDATPPGDPLLRLAALLHDVAKPRTKEGEHFYRHELLGAEMAAAMLARLRFSNEEIATVAHLIRHHLYTTDPVQTDAAIRRFIRRVGPEHLERLFALRRADVAGSGLPERGEWNRRFEERVRAELARKAPLRASDLAIGGEEVIDALVRAGLAPPGFRGDRRVGDLLGWLLEQVTEVPERNERETLLALLEQRIAAERAADAASAHAQP